MLWRHVTGGPNLLSFFLDETKTCTFQTTTDQVLKGFRFTVFLQWARVERSNHSY